MDHYPEEHPAWRPFFISSYFSLFFPPIGNLSLLHVSTLPHSLVANPDPQTTSSPPTCRYYTPGQGQGTVGKVLSTHMQAEVDFTRRGGVTLPIYIHIYIHI